MGTWSRWWLLAALAGCGSMSGDDTPGDDGEVAVDDHGPGITASSAPDYAAEVLITGLAAATTGNPVPLAGLPESCAFGGQVRTQPAMSVTFTGCNPGYGRIVDGALTFTSDGAGNVQQPEFGVDALLTVRFGELSIASAGRYHMTARLDGGSLDDLEIAGDALAVTVRDGDVVRNHLAMSAFDVRATTDIVLDYGPESKLSASFRLASDRLRDTLGVTTTDVLTHAFQDAHPSSGALTVTGAGDSRLSIIIHGSETAALAHRQLELRIARGTAPLGPPLWLDWADLPPLARKPAP